MIRRMGGADAFFLGLETPRAYMHTFKSGILDPSDCPEGWSFDIYRERVRRRIHRVPPFHWRYVSSPLGLAYPLWVEDPDFNLDYHLRHVALVTLTHHAYFDGAGASNAMMNFFNTEPDHDEDPEPPSWVPGKIPSWPVRLATGAAALPLILARGVPRAIAGLRKARRLSRDMEAAGKPAHPIVASRGTDINSLVSLAPEWLTRIIAWAIHHREGRVGIFGNVILSNVPGPRCPLYLAPTKVTNWFSTGQVFDGTSVNMTMWSYCGKAYLCIFADQAVLPDGWKLYKYFTQEPETLVDLAEIQYRAG